MCCPKAVAKLILIVFNVVFFLLGIAALALGIFLIVDKSYLLGIIGNIPGTSNYDVASVLNSTSYLENGAYMLIAAGAFVFVIGFCGMCGGIRESKCLLYVYAFFVFLILAVEVAAGVLGYFYEAKLQTYLQTWLLALVSDYYTGATLTASTLALSSDSTGISDAIDFAQVTLQCCGVSNYSDFSTSATNWPANYSYTSGASTVAVTGALVPVSCCKMSNPSSWPASLSSIQFVDVGACLTSATDASTNLVDCYTKVVDLLNKYSKIALGIGIGVASAEVLGILSACSLIRAKNKDEIGIA